MFQKKLRYASGLTFHALETANTFIDYIPGELNRLVVTFENADAPARPRLDGLREPWGGGFLHGKGFSVLGIKPKQVDWYRGNDLHEFFRSHGFRMFVSSFKQVVFYGSSMGGFGALSFAAACPGATVIAFNPQSTLHPDLVPWEERYPEGRAQDWSGDFSDGRDGARSADKVYVAYDPLFAPDRRHVERLDGGNLVRFEMPLVGHVIAGWMLQAKVLSSFLDEALSGTLTEARCQALARRRRNIAHYYWSMAARTRSPSVASACIRSLTGFGLPTHHQGDLAALLVRHRLWDWLEREPVAEALERFDDGVLFAVLKPAADDGRLETAYGICRTVMRRRDAGWPLLVLAAECAHRLGRLDEALAVARRAVAAAPGIGNCHRVLARILADAGMVEEACAVGERGVAAEPASVLGWLDLARHREALGQWAAARDGLDRARTLMPDDPHLGRAAEALAARTPVRAMSRSDVVRSDAVA